MRFSIWIPPILWFLFISILSQIPGASGQSTGRLFEGDWNLVFRSLAHLFVFFVQGITWLMALEKQGRLSSRKVLIVAFILTALCGALDELHQSLVPNRSCRLQDVVKDTVAGGLAVLFWIQLKKNKK